MFTRRQVIVASSAGLFALPVSSITGQTARSVANPIGTAIDRYMRQAAVYGFSGQVIATRGGELLLNGSYGWADRRHRRRMTRDTPMGVASVSKQFTAAAILKLAELGRLAVQDPLSRFLPDLPADKASLTLHQLLTHTSGMPGGDVVDDFEVASKTELLERILHAPVAAAPGAGWRYSNSGYNLLAFVIERAAGTSYEAFLGETLFRAAGMRDSGIPGHGRFDTARVSHSYQAWLDRGTPSSWPRENFRPFGSGTVFSTARDLLRWQTALESGRVLQPASAAQLVAPHAQPGTDRAIAYGYGAFIENHPAGRFIERSGDWERGYNAAWHRWPEEDLTLIIVSNSTTAAGVSMRQSVQAELESFLRQTQPPPATLAPSSEPSASLLRRLAGNYRLPDGDMIGLVSDGAYLWAVPEGQRAVDRLRTPGGSPNEGYDAAMRKTEELIAGAAAADREAYARALGPDRASSVDEYWAEWSRLSAAHGNVLRTKVLGVARQGRSARALARLEFANGIEHMSFLWGAGGAGSLLGTRTKIPVPAPLAYPLGVTSDGLVGVEMMNVGRSNPYIADRDLRFGGDRPTVAARVA